MNTFRSGSDPWPGHSRGSRAYKRLLVGLFCAGVATFAQLYSFQTLLPEVSADFEVDAATAALTVSASTLGVAASVIPWSTIADRVGRVQAMTFSVITATILGLGGVFFDSIQLIIGVRLLEGFALGGVPAVAIAYLNEEINKKHAARAAAIYVAGTSIGGLSGRIVSGPVSELFDNWRLGVLAVLTLCVISAVIFILAMPEAHGFVPLRKRPKHLLPDSTVMQRVWLHLRTPQTLVLFLFGFLLMGSFVAIYNYLGFRLSGSPYNLPTSIVSALFTAYLIGTFSSSLAGSTTEKFGRFRVLIASTLTMALGAAVSMAEPLWLVIAGLLLITAGFFAAHAVAAGWVGTIATTGRAQAGSLYNLFYYAGSSVLGWFGGGVFQAGGWNALVAMVVVALLLLVILGFAVLRHADAVPSSRKTE